MKTDYQKTGKLYKKLNAYVLGNCSQQFPYADTFYYFGSSVQFKTCKSFKEFLSEKHSGSKFTVEIDKRG